MKKTFINTIMIGNRCMCYHTFINSKGDKCLIGQLNAINILDKNKYYYYEPLEYDINANGDIMTFKPYAVVKKA